jgi:glucoamylase
LTRRYRVTVLTILLLCGSSCVFAQEAPGRPGNDAHWPTAAKTGFGTSASKDSNVWFTLANGVMTEAYFPTFDTPNTQCLQLIICNRSGCQTEADDMTHEVRVASLRSLTFQQINKSKDLRYTITKTYVTDPANATILIQATIAGLSDDRDRVYVYYDPSLANSGMHDTAKTTPKRVLLAFDHTASALLSSSGFGHTTNGFFGRSDGLVQLKSSGNFKEYSVAADGNVVQVAQIRRPQSFTLALGFGINWMHANARAYNSLARGFSLVRKEYEAGWSAYLDTLKPVPERYRQKFHMAAMVLKGLEDKLIPGATVASPSSPWGGGPNANEATVTGYHAVWARDLYQVATALYLAGDEAAANRALDYLFNVQQLSDGSFPQNSHIDGSVIGRGVQLDQVALPIVLAHQLGRHNRATWLKHIKPAAEFLIQHGPATQQDRWEEKAGYSPSTIAAEIAGLVCAAEIAKKNDDESYAANYLKKADEWVANVEKWTATSNGPHGDGKYFLRISEHGNPNHAAKIEINSGGGTYDQREIVDAGFLELVRLGIKRANDPLILKSLAVVDKLLKVETPVGPGWYRYNHDAYGERPDGGDYDARNGKGRLWTLLTGERAEYELARGNVEEAQRLLDTMGSLFNEGLMLPEQVWESNGKGTGSATPLAWSMAQFMRLVLNVEARRNLETPDVVTRRYLVREN